MSTPPFKQSKGDVTLTPDSQGNIGNFVKDYVKFSGSVEDPVLKKPRAVSTEGWMTAARVFAAGYTSDLDWGVEPTWCYLINWMPITGASLYLGMYPDYMRGSLCPHAEGNKSRGSAPQTCDSWLPRLEIDARPTGREIRWSTPTYGPRYLYPMPRWQPVPKVTSILCREGKAESPLNVYTQWAEAAKTQAKKVASAGTPDYQMQLVFFQETGSTIAAAYNYIASLAKHGRPLFGGRAVAHGKAIPMFAIFLDDVNQKLNLVAHDPSATSVQFYDAAGSKLGDEVTLSNGQSPPSSIYGKQL